MTRNGTVEDRLGGAVILAGGRSRRFGDADKATAMLADRPMIRHVADKLVPLVDELVINCRAEQRERIDEALDGVEMSYRFAVDPTPGLGPMAGIATGLSALDRAQIAIVVACDMPFVEREVLRLLVERAGSADAAVPRVDGKWFETTHAVYWREPMIAACRAALEADEDRIVHALDRLDLEIVEDTEIGDRGSLESFRNINTREELEAADEELRGQSEYEI